MPLFSHSAPFFFAPMDEIGTPREYAGSAMTVGCIVGYMPSMFAYALYGSFIDNHPGLAGYNYVFYCMAAFLFAGFLCATVLARRIRRSKAAAA